MSAKMAKDNPQLRAGMNQADMMNNPALKEMMNNPETLKQAMSAMNGQGDPVAMQDMMKNPSMQNLLNNPEMITNAVNMMKGNPAMLDAMAAQLPQGVDRNTMLKGLEWLASLARFYARSRSFVSNKYVQLSFIIAIVSFFFWYF